MKLLKRRVEPIFLNTIRRGHWSPVPADAPIKLVIDIGASVGLFSVWARMRWPAAEVLAVEPAASEFACLQENVRGLGIVPWRAAFGPPGFSALANPDGHFWERHYAPADSGVPMRDLYDMVGPHTDGVLLKIDCEGAEHQLMGDLDIGTAVLRRAAAICIEVHPPLDIFPKWFLSLLEHTHDIQTLSTRARSYVMHAVRKGFV